MFKRHRITINTFEIASYIQSKNLSWSTINTDVKTHQKQIYEFALIGDVLKVRSLQNQLFISQQACLLAISCILNKHEKHQLNFREVKNDFLFVQNCKFIGLNFIYRFVNNNDDFTINLILQELFLIILRPEWEARIEDNSYGFSSRLSVKQAVIKTYSVFNQNKSYERSTVLIGRQNNWLKRIDVSLVLKKSNCSGYLKKYLSSICTNSLLLSSFRLVNQTFQSIDIVDFPAKSMSLLLSNILFYGLETAISWKTKKFIYHSNECENNDITTIVCADHFLVIFPYQNLQFVSSIINVMRSFFDSLCLALPNSLIKVVSIDEGFDFLGFNFKRYPNRQLWNQQSTKLIVRPTTSNMKKHILSMRYCLYHKDRLNRWRANTQMTQYDVISQINPLIKEFSRYYQDLVPSYVLKDLDKTLNQVIYSYAIKKYKSNKSQKWDDNWTVVINGKKIIAYKNNTPNGYSALYLHSQININ